MGITFNTSANISDILTNMPTGSNKEYLLKDKIENHLDAIIKVANQLMAEQADGSIFITVKFNSMYGKREKRIEIVKKNIDGLALYKLSKHAEFDKDALALVNIQKELNNMYPEIKIKSILVFPESEDLTFIKSSLKKMDLIVDVIGL